MPIFTISLKGGKALLVGQQPITLGNEIPVDEHLQSVLGIALVRLILEPIALLIPARQQPCPRGRTDGRGDVALLKGDAPLADGIDVGRLDELAAIERDVVLAEVVRQDDDDVGALRTVGRGQRGEVVLLGRDHFLIEGDGHVVSSQRPEPEGEQCGQREDGKDDEGTFHGVKAKGWVLGRKVFRVSALTRCGIIAKAMNSLRSVASFLAMTLRASSLRGRNDRSNLYHFQSVLF
jgi:hypothetical protein